MGYNDITVAACPYFELVKSTVKKPEGGVYDSYRIDDMHTSEAGRYGLYIFIEADDQTGKKEVITWSVDVGGVSDRKPAGDISEFADVLSVFSKFVADVSAYFEKEGYEFVRISMPKGSS